jgi:TonB family protein
MEMPLVEPEKVYQPSEVHQKPELIFAKEGLVPAGFLLDKKEMVVMHVKLNKRGDVIDAKIIASSAKQLNAPALKAIYHWKHKPARFAGQPVAVYLDLTLEFFPQKPMEQTQND